MALTDTDRSLIRDCQARDPIAWRNFVDRFAGLFVHVVQHTAHSRSIVLPREEVDDLCSEIYLTILTNDFGVLRNFRGESALAPYLAVIARRVIVKELSRRRMAEALGHVKAHGEAIDVAIPSEVYRIESRDLVQQMLTGLPQKEAEVVRQYHLEGKSYQEISSGLGVPENSIGPTLSRAREKLRRTLTPLS